MSSARRWWWLAASVATVAIGTAGACLTVPRTDTTWLLHVTGKVLDGAALGVDIVENSPPVILWLKAPVVLLARATGWDAWFIWLAAVALLGVTTLFLCSRLLPRLPSLARSSEMIVAVLAVGLFLLPLLDFGQREHVAIALVIPWLLAVAARAEGTPVATGFATVLAFMGGLGLSVKPHFGLVWLGMAMVLFIRGRGARALLAPELTAAALVPAFAILATLLLHPGWLGYARVYGPLYLRYGSENPLWIGLVGEGIEWSWLGVLALLAFAPVLRPWPASLTVLAVGLAGFHLAAALQGKGWVYHFLPAAVVGLLTAAAAGASAEWRGDRLVQRIYRLAIPVGIAIVAWGGLRRTVELAVLPGRKWVEADPNLRGLVAEVRRSGRRETVLFISINMAAGFPLTYLADADWTMRHPSLWPLGAVYATEFGMPGMVTPHTPPDGSVEERRIALDLEEDIARRPPTIVIIPGPDQDAPLWAGSQRFDYRAYFAGRLGGSSIPCTDRPAVPVGAYLVWRCARVAR